MYWIPLTKSKYHQNIVLLLGSYLFYGWWDYRFLSLILFSSLLDFVLGKKIHELNDPKLRKLFLYISLFSNLGLLFVFKYFNFFVDSFLTAFSIEHSENFFRIVLPVGISFYTFQTLSYTIDVYRKELVPSQKLINFLTFVSFFPQLVAGPIERAKNFLPQIERTRTFSYANAVVGCRHILFGLFKKVVIADNLAEIVNILFEIDSPYTGVISIIGVCLFALQIYCDFSGYSEIAIGTAKLFNINLMTNFRQPYFSTSLTEFWSRWHISLSTWFRDYLYIPLGGNKGSNYFTIRNLMLTFLVSGLWHGANWTFLIWGAIHGGFIVLEKYVFKQFKTMKTIGFVTTLCTVLIAWVFFRAENMQHALNYISGMFEFNNSLSTSISMLISDHSELTIGHLGIVMALTVFFITVEFFLVRDRFIALFNKYYGLRISSYVVLSFMIFLFGSYQNPSEFIYFQF